MTALLAAADVVLAMAPTYEKGGMGGGEEIGGGGGGRGLLAVRLAAVEGDAAVVHSVLARVTLRRELAYCARSKALLRRY